MLPLTHWIAPLVGDCWRRPPGSINVSGEEMGGEMHIRQTPGKGRRTATGGFTLVELMVTIAVAAVLLAIATPSFTAIRNSNRLTGAANELVATLQSARMEAVRLNAHAEICPSSDGVSCGGASWNQWLIRVDSNRDGVIDETVRSGEARQPVQVLVSNSIAGGSITFSPDGRAYEAGGQLLEGTIAVCIPTTNPDENIRYVSIASGSRLSSTAADGGGACAVPGNAAAGAGAGPIPTGGGASGGAGSGGAGSGASGTGGGNNGGGNNGGGNDGGGNDGGGNDGGGNDGGGNDGGGNDGGGNDGGGNNGGGNNGGGSGGGQQDDPCAGLSGFFKWACEWRYG